MFEGPTKGMRTMKRIAGWFAFAIAVAAVMAVPALTALAETGTTLHQSSSETREECLRECKSWIEEYAGRGGRGFGGIGRQLANMYARCVADCERRFWKEWDREMENLD